MCITRRSGPTGSNSAMQADFRRARARGGCDERTLLGAKGIATRSKGLTTRNKKLVERI